MSTRAAWVVVILVIGLWCGPTVGDESDWQPMTCWTTRSLMDVWGSGPNDVYIVGEKDIGPLPVYHYDGSAWLPLMDGPELTVDLHGIWGSGPNDIFAVGEEGTIVYYNGSAWSEMTSGADGSFNDVWGSGPNDVYAVGERWWPDEFPVYHYDGSTWSMATGPEMIDELYAVWGSAPNDVFAVGQLGTILHYDGSAWSEATTGIWLFDVWGSAPNDVFTVGELWMPLWFPMYHYDGSTWSSVEGPLLESDLDGIWGSGPNDVFAVGHSGTIVRYGGASWSEMSSGSSKRLNAVWGSGRYDVFAVGDDGTVLHYSPLYALTVTINDEQRGAVTADPNLPSYPGGTPVTLTGEPNEGSSFNKWKMHDPLDANNDYTDTNNPTTLVMDRDWEVKAAFKCGSELGPMLPMILVGLGMFAVVRRRG